MNRQNLKDNKDDVVDDIGKCLISLGIENSQLIPRSVVQLNLRQQKPEFNLFHSNIAIFPLDWFYSNDDDIKFFIQCKTGIAFLPRQSINDSQDNSSVEYEWMEVDVEGYNEMTNKWRVKTRINNINSHHQWYEVSRVYLMFIVEKAAMFAERVRKAIEFRDECEKRLRFESIIDHISLSHIPKPPLKIRNKIKQSVEDGRSYDGRWIELFEWEYTMWYQRVQVRDEILKFTQIEHHRIDKREEEILSTFPIQFTTMATVVVVVEDVDKMKKLKNVQLQKTTNKMRFEQSRKDFLQMYLYCCPQAIKIMDIVNNICDSVTRMSLFHIQTLDCSEVIDLNGFVAAHDDKLSQISHFFRHEWIRDVVEKIKFHLQTGGGGWMDVKVAGSDWYVYKNSKLFRLIELVKYRMQIAMRDAVRLSARAYVKRLCDPCEKILLSREVEEICEFSQFHTQHPIFKLEIAFDDESNEPIYTTPNLDGFLSNITRIFESTILVAHQVPHIDPFLIEALKFDQSLRLSSVGSCDEEIQRHMQQLELSYRACVRPLMAYLKEYQRFSQFRALNVSDFVLAEMDMLSSASELKDEITRQLQEIEEIEQTVPSSSIVIGPFEVHVSKIREELIVKHKTLYTLLRKLFINKIETSLTSIQRDFQIIHNKLTQNVECVEEIVTIQNWIPNIGIEVGRIDEKLLNLMNDDVAVLAQLNIALSDEMFALYVSNRLWPMNILSKIDETQKQLLFEFEQFRKLQTTHQLNFIEKMATYKTDVEEFCTNNIDDDEKCKKVWNDLEGHRKFGEMLNERQKIFNQPEIDMTPLNILMERLGPYHNFFITTSNFLQLMEKWTTKTKFSMMNMSLVKAEVERCENVINKSRSHFNDNEEMMMLIEKISSKLSIFTKGRAEILADLTNPDLDKEQLSAMLSKKTGIVVRFSPEMTLESFLIQAPTLDMAHIIRDVSEEIATSARERKAEKERKSRKETQIMIKKKSRLAARKDI